MPGLIGALVGLFAAAVLLLLSMRFMRKANPVDSSVLILEESEGELSTEWNPKCAPYEKIWERLLYEEKISIEVSQALDEYRSGKRVLTSGICIVCEKPAFPRGPAADCWMDVFCGVHIMEGFKQIDYFGNVRLNKKEIKQTAA